MTFPPQTLLLPITDPEEDLSVFFTVPTSLGFVDSKSPSLEIEIGRQTYTIYQGISGLISGQTGQLVWRSSIHFANWLSKQDWFKPKNVVELGSGTGLLACVLREKCKRYIATDQRSLLRLLRKNTDAEVLELDWTHPVKPCEMDYILACDVVYNENLIEPLVQTLEFLASVQTIVIIAGELRSFEVAVQFLQVWRRSFHVWIVGDDSLNIIIWIGKRKSSPR
ncbi:Diaminohydroxyphosphoribosylamino-pyrimidine deaminase [Neolecta irregularis DAH-3]|uniref:Diaminohydroxyphosphoribosylamino-pyrimidine deaminase n=1 Tax=Neolecta irregularis (strain DAH-3) TaxID=1198029 RepID=A0A1U7LI92_NEOID|nr:Diaminohydroxyphosphoribosylamino-pyrimidine deaminase [Neolecta irregularis DAH-3]|eukprot:OLL22380.1 Diaminohydroxyphosphoribosylamino-pyrimidine deaminase [Neolecta irregularis DAH-3]